MRGTRLAIRAMLILLVVSAAFEGVSTPLRGEPGNEIDPRSAEPRQEATAPYVFPKAAWEHREPEALGLSRERLDALARSLGGRGCVVKNGYVVKTWGDQSLKGDVYSSAKPMLGTLLLFALKEGKIRGLDQPLSDFGWDLKPKDRDMTLRHLTNMTSGYARPERPGEAWSYNDFAIQLYQKTLFDRIFRDEPRKVAADRSRLGAIGLEDGLEFRATNRRIKASVRDFARIAWFWLNRGAWDGEQLLPRDAVDDVMRPQVPRNLPLTRKAETDDYLSIGTYGGGSDHFSQAGPGIYGFNWWFNAHGRATEDRLIWPDAPADLFLSLGHRGNSSAVLPSLGAVVVAEEADWGSPDETGRNSKLNQRLAEIAAAVGNRVP
ncbi:serine hydrolase domain-containing protein [Paludisphaera rhizosphaerae]|uniref:serine hydrolase domain-containing protein n=1 Tax=Paludisphaera rhizosphaerae TaxID=2711216 RepID=UPI0013EB8D27|nr:serine hydrolase [Paludisphaera rhizosphaerae]